MLAFRLNKAPEMTSLDEYRTVSYQYMVL